MDLEAVKAASTAELVKCVIGAAVNAEGLLEDAELPAGQVEGMLQDAQMLAEDVDRLKQRGLYADIDRSRQARLPSEVTETDVAAVLARARLAVSATSVLLAPGMAAQLTDPPADAIELCRALVSAFAEAGSGRTPKAAADVMLNTVTKLQKQTAADAWTSSSRKPPAGSPASGYHPRQRADGCAAQQAGRNRQTAEHRAHRPPSVDPAAFAGRS